MAKVLLWLSVVVLVLLVGLVKSQEFEEVELTLEERAYGVGYQQSEYNLGDSSEYIADCPNNLIRNPSFSNYALNPSTQCPNAMCCNGGSCPTPGGVIPNWNVQGGAIGIYSDLAGVQTTISEQLSAALVDVSVGSPGTLSSQFVTPSNALFCTASWYDSSRDLTGPGGACSNRSYLAQIREIDLNTGDLIPITQRIPTSAVGPNVIRRFLNFPANPRAVYQIAYTNINNNGGTCGAFIDDVCVTCGADPSPSLTSSLSFSSSLSLSPSVSPSISESSTPSISESSSPSISESSSPSISESSSISESASSSTSPSLTATSSTSPTTSSSATPSISTTKSLSASRTSAPRFPTRTARPFFTATGRPVRRDSRVI